MELGTKPLNDNETEEVTTREAERQTPVLFYTSNSNETRRDFHFPLKFGSLLHLSSPQNLSVNNKSPFPQTWKILSHQLQFIHY